MPLADEARRYPVGDLRAPLALPCGNALHRVQYPIVLVVLFLMAGGSGYFVIRGVQRNRQKAAIAADREYQVRAQQSYHLAPYMSMTPREFEDALAFLCTRDGCTQARVTGGAGDLGADVIATTPEGWKLVIQAKRYTAESLVTGPDLQKFGGTAFAVHRADAAVVVTTSGFTRQAQQYAAGMNIRLFDRDGLAGWVGRTGPAPWHSGSMAAG